MRSLAVFLALGLGAAGFAAGRLTAAPAKTAPAVVVQRVVASAPLREATACDEAKIAAAVARSLDGEARRPEPPAAVAASPEQDVAAARGDDVLGRARANRHLSERDADELRAALREMSPDQREAAMRELSGALNRGELAVDVMPPI